MRLDAELVRDAVLRASGLLSEKIGGPSVFPPQPPGVSSEGTYGALEWKVSEGEDRYRRGIYTFTKRTAPYAMFSTFDAPSGEACLARREVSNTPLQSLTLLNDAVFVEAAQALGKRLAAAKRPVDERASELFRRCVGRPALGRRARPAGRVLRDASRSAGQGRARRRGDRRRRGRGRSRAGRLDSHGPAVLNLDETITKE